jgi:Ser-tRNA(Ala) deacylase AlaX
MNAPTVLKYMEQNAPLVDKAIVCDIATLDTGKISLVLDSTIFYPQGGGQPYDQGTIEIDDEYEFNCCSAVFSVEEVRFKDGIVYHIGIIISGAFRLGDHVVLHVNQERRLFNSRNHTAGHIIDCAMYELGFSLIPASGYHFPEGAYIEYIGTMEEDKRSDLISKLQSQVNAIIARTLPITVKMVSLVELKQLAKFVPDYIPADKPSRAMIIAGCPAIPCGGTHAHNTQEIKHMVIEKIGNKKGNVRISYSIA